jgi:hypothetical protein
MNACWIGAECCTTKRGSRDRRKRVEMWLATLAIDPPKLVHQARVTQT